MWGLGFRGECTLPSALRNADLLDFASISGRRHPDYVCLQLRLLSLFPCASKTHPLHLSVAWDDAFMMLSVPSCIVCSALCCQYIPISRQTLCPVHMPYFPLLSPTVICLTLSVAREATLMILSVASDTVCFTLSMLDGCLSNSEAGTSDCSSFSSSLSSSCMHGCCLRGQHAYMAVCKKKCTCPCWKAACQTNMQAPLNPFPNLDPLILLH